MRKKLFLFVFLILGLCIFAFLISGPYLAADDGLTDDPPIEEPGTPPVEEEQPEEKVGFFENLIIGIFDFIASPQFTRICTALAALLAAIYPFVKKYLSAKAQAKYQNIVNKLQNAEQELDKYKQLALQYAGAADTMFNHVEAIKEALVLGFDKSNLRTDVKDKIIGRLNSVPKIDLKSLAVDAIKKVEPAKAAAEKDVPVAEIIPEPQETPPTTGW